MKKLALVLGIIMVSVFSINAQTTAASSETPAQKMIDKLTTACQLTPAQVTKVKPMVASFLKTRAENEKKYASDADGLKTANKTNRDNFKTQVSAILTPAQQEKFTEFQKEQQESKATSN